MLGWMTLICSGVWCAVVATASVPTTQPVTQPAATQPATQPATSGDPRVDAILVRLEARGAEIRDLSAKLTWQLYDEVVEETQARHGELLYRHGKPYGRFLIRFDDMVIDNRVQADREWIGFADGWSIEKKEVTKSVVKRQWARPGEDVDLFTVGKGPFPMPFGQRKADILKYFQVSLLPSTPTDPANTDHLLLIPRKGTEMADRCRRLDFHIDRKLGLPIRIRSVEKDEKIMTSDFAAIAINTGLPDSRFHISEPRDYQIDVEPLPPAPK